MKKQFLIPSVMFGLLSALVISARTPFPAQAAENDALAVAHEHIQLVQAIRAAEQEVGGIASKAEYKQRKEIGQYKVEVVRGYDVFDVVVDADNGSILKIKKMKPIMKAAGTTATSKMTETAIRSDGMLAMKETAAIGRTVAI